MEGSAKKLGFGLMRLPRKGLGIDVQQVSEMVDLFLERGFTYFDTAFVYPGSEAAIRRALVDRYPRDRYTLATKLYAPAAPTRAMAEKEFETSLKRTNAGYIDYYLLHSIMESNYRKYEKFELWDYVSQLKKEGKIHHYGFSFHSTPKLLDQLLTEHPDVDFVQLQINYADWENSRIQSRANYETARRHGKQIVIMEPVKGGTLADPPEEVKKLMKDYNPAASCASWAIRFAAGLDGVLAVLSGMSSLPQVEDNTSYMQNFIPLNEEEQKIIQKAQRILGHSSTIPCTSCHYCAPGCPKQIPIPEIFSARNKALGNGLYAEAEKDYQKIEESGHKASDCIHCHACEKACPQHIEITRELEKIASAYESQS